VLCDFTPSQFTIVTERHQLSIAIEAEQIELREKFEAVSAELVAFTANSLEIMEARNSQS
jgi:hypothetical protein